MMKNPLVSVIIPTHNRRELLSQTLDSVRRQSFQDWECIVVDDASSDDTQDFLQAQNDIRSIRFDTPQERTRARNSGLKNSRGEFVLFLDDDDLLPEYAIESHFRALQNYPGTFGCTGGCEIFWPDGARQQVQVINKLVVRDVVEDMLFGWIPVSGQWLFRKHLIEEIGAWNEDMVYAEDHELLLRLALCNKAIIIPKVVHFYRAHDQWRPDNMDNIMTRVREDAIANLPVEDRRRYLAVLASRALRESAESAYQDANMFKAFKLYSKMLRLAPGVFISPLTRSDVLPPLMKSLLGGRLISWVRSVRHRPKEESTK